jgi:hypothetical protein
MVTIAGSLPFSNGGFTGQSLVSVGGIFSSIDNLINGTQYANNNGTGIDNFKAIIGKRNDLLQDNRFLMIIQVPPIMLNQKYSSGQDTITNTGVLSSYGNTSMDQINQLGDSKAIASDLPFFCKAVALPSFELVLEPYLNQGYGAVSYMPTGQTFGALPSLFYGDSNGMVLSFFQTWFKYIVNLNYESYLNAADVNSAYPFEMFFKSDYATTANIIVYNNRSEKVIVYEFEEVFPSKISDIPLDWISQNKIIEIPIVFAYKAFRTSSFKSAIGSEGRGLSLSKILTSTGTIVQAISGLNQKPQTISSVVNIVSTGFGLKNLLNI